VWKYYATRLNNSVKNSINIYYIKGLNYEI
jgi:hypothetical protein